MNNRFKGVFKDAPTYIDVSTGYCQEIKGSVYYTEAFVNCLRKENQQLKEEYQNELDENCKLSELWRKSQEENRELKQEIEKYRSIIENTREEYIDW